MSSIRLGCDGLVLRLPSRKKASVPLQCCGIPVQENHKIKQKKIRCEYLMPHFSIAWEEKVIFLFFFYWQEQRKVFAKQLSLSPFHTYCRHLCSSASIQFDAIMCQIVSSEDTSKRCLFPFVSGLSFSIKRSHSQRRTVWGVCLIRLSKVSRINGEVSQESCFHLQRYSFNNKLKVMDELTFLSKHDVEKLEKKNPLNNFDINIW